MYDTVIEYRVDLAVQLVNTATGRTVTGPGVRFLRDGQPLTVLEKSGGFYVALNIGRLDFDLRIEADGFEPLCRRMEYHEIKKIMPQIIHLVPQNAATGLQKYLTLEGVLPGIEALSGVFLRGFTLRISNFDARKRHMTVFNQHGKRMERYFYALLNPQMNAFQPFTATPCRGVEEIEIKEPLQSEFSLNAPIAPLIFGAVDAQGKYLFRVNDDSGEAAYLLRYLVNGAEYFQTVDFHSKENIKLEGGVSA